MGEGGHGGTFTNDDLILIGSVYSNILHAGGPLTRSSFYGHRNSKTEAGLNYRMYMYGLGSPNYSSNKEAKKRAGVFGSLIERAKQIYPTFYRALTDKTCSNAVLDNPGIQSQGYWGDLNKWWDPAWKRLGWYRAYEQAGISDRKGNPIANIVITILGTDADHVNATYLIDGNAAVRWLSSLSCGIQFFNAYRAPHLNHSTDTYTWSNPLIPIIKK